MGMAASARESSSGPHGRDPGLRRAATGRDAGAPLTVAAVAARLGVAASTLRTWDRRYGLGPSSHEAGSHRRYTPTDVARLERMRHLTLAGRRPVRRRPRRAQRGRGRDRAAARAGRRRSPPAGTDEPSHHERLLVDPLSLAAAAMEPDEPRVHRMLGQEVRDSGIVKAWTGLASRRSACSPSASAPTGPGWTPRGSSPWPCSREVREAAAAAERAGRARCAAASRRSRPPPAPSVLLCAAGNRRLQAHVIGGGLAERGVRARVIRAESLEDPEQTLRMLTERGAGVLAVVGNPRAPRRSCAAPPTWRHRGLPPRGRRPGPVAAAGAPRAHGAGRRRGDREPRRGGAVAAARCPLRRVADATDAGP